MNRPANRLAGPARTMARAVRPAVFALSAVLLTAAACRVEREPRVTAASRPRLVELAVHLVDLPYRYGGRDIDGFDCSGLVQYVYGSYGFDLPRGAREQSRLRRRVRPGQARPGDILAFHIGGKWHTAIFIGDGRFVHAPSAGGRVRVETLNDYWRRALVAVIDRLD